ncbi:MAG: hypothetical protein DI637_12510 [Citromicrobium sp.]|nr:MAG: hypothetical protein DI637_12510 [Citromicrobium sp.]
MPQFPNRANTLARPPDLPPAPRQLATKRLHTNGYPEAGNPFRPWTYLASGGPVRSGHPPRVGPAAAGNGWSHRNETDAFAI